VTDAALGPEPDLRDPLGLRTDAPLLDGWLQATADVAAGRRFPFTVPGHHQREDLVGQVIRGDHPLYGGVATIKDTPALLAEAQARAAALWGADWCRFSVAGSTHGNQALALGVGRPGQDVVVSRTLHRSLLLGLVLAGLNPVWVRPEVDPGTGLPTSVPVTAIEAALAAHPDACGVFLGDPSYVGTVGDLAGQAGAAHAAGVPLVVDAAWAAHFGFHPALPAHALAAGADAMVVSAHKALPAYTQAAIVFARIGLLDADRLERAFEATHTTSPSGTIAASIDATRALLGRHGHDLCARLLEVVAAARARLTQVPGLRVLAGPGVDPSKLVVLLAGTGAHGHAVEQDLIAAGSAVEMADRDTIVAMVTLADDHHHLTRFCDLLSASVQRHRSAPRPVVAAAAWTVEPEVALPPRQAFFARHLTLPTEQAVGRISAELIAPYPPGIPVLAPGERITRDTVDLLRAAAADGGRIAYAADPSLASFQVVDQD
jgi:arginine decarboxylase